MKKLQFPWRITAVLSFSSAVLAGLVGRYLLKSTSLRIIIIVFLLFASMKLTLIQKIPPKPDSFYLSYSGTTSFHGETTPRWVVGDASAYAKYPLEIISGDGRLTNFQRKNNNHSFLTINNSEITILDNTVYFPGWQASVDGRKVPIEFQNILHRGLIIFSVPRGKHKVEVRFSESPIRLTADIVSLTSLLVISTILIVAR